ncbi:cytochrome c [Actibacterium sp. 188UL27-1]|uniref:c-type cytochrome n=1 Tax=Actibacterium sp. 188UL27-1 TaxID=2786961 RepID=UPI00195C702E|nr:cytochrome c [Actibacterium sp. 188UL27-1]MBM7066860.1 cytochrome c [Actibacterium sp. 188UL27-1]
MHHSIQLVLLSLALFFAGPATAQSGDVAEGQALFQTYCATCHGNQARGDGPTAEMMVINPPDLTQLAAMHDGEFPVLWVARRIDGRDLIPSHGLPMPIFGSFFEGTDVPIKVPTGQPMMVSQPLADLLVWLESIQE